MQEMAEMQRKENGKYLTSAKKYLNEKWRATGVDEIRGTEEKGRGIKFFIDVFFRIGMHYRGST